MMKLGKKLSDIVFIACVLCFLGGAALLTAFGEKEEVSFYENRRLATMATWSEETVMSGQWGKEVEAYLADHVAYRDELLQFDTYVKSQILKQPLIKNVVINGEYLLPYISKAQQDVSQIPTAMEQVAQNIDSVRDFAESCGARFYYVAVPCQSVVHGDDYPSYMRNLNDYITACRSAFSARMAQENISYIDIGTAFEAQGWNDALSSNIDNHSSMTGAYVTYYEIVSRLNQELGLSFDVLEMNEFTTTVLPNPYRGSRIKALMDMWESDEKLRIIEPLTPIPFTRKNYGLEAAAEVYQLPKNAQDPVEYGLYMGGDYSVTEIDTHRPELPNVLIYGDSFTNAVECLLYTSCNKMWSMDLRYCDKGALKEYIDVYRPDVVIAMRNYEAMMTTVDNGQGI